MPDSHGVYLMMDAGGNVIYVGKAISLRNRVRQHFRASRDYDPKEAAMMAAWLHRHDLDRRRDGGVVLECNLIKRHHPHYNILLKDDKHYPYLRIDMNDPFPRVEITRRMDRDRRVISGLTSAPELAAGAGRGEPDVPHSHVQKVHRPASARDRPCLNYQMGRCPAPCAGLIHPRIIGRW
jgi:excinuclease ABC subunit C